MRRFSYVLSLLLLANIARAAVVPAPPALCETAINTAEYTGRLPPRLLHSIALVESGRLDEKANTVRPWPWTINAEGAGAFFASKNDAIAAVKKLQARGVRSIDVGCLQVNLMFHPNAFASLDEAFDPRANALYAARFLNQLHAPGDNWMRAIAAYHSDTPALGAPYRALVMLRWQNPSLAPPQVLQVAYRAFTSPQHVYNAFAPLSQVYGSASNPARP
jgi:hypothetical protein